MSRPALRRPDALSTFPFPLVSLPHTHSSVLELCPAPTLPRDVPLGLEGTEQKRARQRPEMGEDGDQCSQSIGKARHLCEHASLCARARVDGA